MGSCPFRLVIRATWNGRCCAVIADRNEDNRSIATPAPSGLRERPISLALAHLARKARTLRKSRIGVFLPAVGCGRLEIELAAEPLAIRSPATGEPTWSYRLHCRQSRTSVPPNERNLHRAAVNHGQPEAWSIFSRCLRATGDAAMRRCSSPEISQNSANWLEWENSMQLLLHACSNS